MANPTTSRSRSRIRVSPSASPSTISISLERSMPRHRPPAMRCARARTTFLRASSSVENFRAPSGGGATLEGPAHDSRELFRLVAKLVEQGEVLGAGRVGHQPLQSGAVLLEECLDGADELLADALVLMVREDGHGADQADGAPCDGQGHPEQPPALLLGHETSPRLH